MCVRVFACVCARAFVCVCVFCTTRDDCCDTHATAQIWEGHSFDWLRIVNCGRSPVQAITSFVTPPTQGNVSVFATGTANGNVKVGGGNTHARARTHRS